MVVTTMIVVGGLLVLLGYLSAIYREQIKARRDIPIEGEPELWPERALKRLREWRKKK